MKKKLVVLVGIFTLLVGLNAQVKALAPADRQTHEVNHLSAQQSLDEWMPDRQLQDALVKEMLLEDKSELTQEALRIYSYKDGKLELRGEFIYNIKGLEYAEYLRTLDLGSNSIKDISPLQSLKEIKYLKLDHNEISDISPLSVMSPLEKLDISNNEVHDLSPLKSLPILSEIAFHYNHVKDLSVLKGAPSLHDLRGMYQGIYNQTTFTGEVGEIIKQKNNVVSFDGNKPNLEARDGDEDYVKYDEDTETVEWKYDKPGDKVATTTFYIAGGASKYPLLQFGGSVNQPMKVTLDQTDITVKDTSLYVGDTWDAKDNLVEAVNNDGKPVGIETGKITVDGFVDTTKVGTYKVTYSIHNSKDVIISKVAVVTVKADQTKIWVKNSTLYVGDSWKPKDNFVEAIDRDGKPVDLNRIEIQGSVDTSKAGTYEVVYKFDNDGQGDTVGSYAYITVKDNQASLEVKDSTLYTGDQWTSEDNFVKASDRDGKSISINDINVEGSVDITKAGVYKIKYTILKETNQKITKEANITIKAEQTSLEVKDTSIYVGNTWKPADNFVKATDKDGEAINIDNVSVEGKVDTTKAGVYKIKYTIQNHQDVKISKEATIVVNADLTDVQVKDSQLYIGDKWNQADNFVKANDKDGKVVEIKDISVEGSVDTSKAGAYKVKYALANANNGKVTKEATITVKGDGTSLEVKDSTIYLEDEWKPADNFVKATDKDGKDVGINGVNVEGSVDTSKEGVNKVTYTILNYNKEKISKEVTITVKTDETSLEIKDSELYVGDTWKAEDNLVKAIDKDGKDVSVSDLKIEGTVDTKNPGINKVMYTIARHNQGKLTKTAVIIVKADQTSIEVENTIININDKWQPIDNFVCATDKDGNPVSIEDITVDGSVDTSKAGVYKVKYTILTHADAKISKEALITVK